MRYTTIDIDMPTNVAVTENFDDVQYIPAQADTNVYFISKYDSITHKTVKSLY